MTNRNLIKPVFVTSILLVFSIVGLGFIIQDISADHGEDPGITEPVVIGPNTLNFRSLTLGNQTSSLTTDFSQAQNGFVIINLEERDANLDAAAIDLVTATANSTTSGLATASITLTESGINTGTFSGTLLLSTTETVGNTLQVSEGDSISVVHEEESPGVGRFQIELDVDTPGNVIINDVRINLANFVVNQVIEPVTHSVNVTLVDGTILDPANPPIITMSYNNSIPGTSFDVSELNMYYKSGPILFDFGPPVGELDICNSNWVEIRSFDRVDPATDVSHDPVAMTITSDIANSEFGQVSGGQIFGECPGLPGFGFPTSGEFMLGYDTGSIGGGGGGGLVRPGFVVNALAGANVISSFFGKGGASGDFTGGSKNGPAKPIVTSGTINNLSDENIGFVQQGITSDSDSTSKSLDSTQNVGIGKDLTFEYNVYENRGPDRIIHATMYFFDAQMMDTDDRINVANSETYIMFEKGKPVKVVDPYGYFEKANFELLPIDTYNAALKYDITFSKIMPESHIVLRTWDTDKYSTDTLFENAIVVNANSILDNDNPSINEEPLTQSEFEASPFLDTQFENELPQEETSTKTGFPGIPLWVKNNAMWWHEKQIDDADFVAGIQYMINEEIITIPETEITNSAPEEIPQWISTIAGYWSNDQIPDDEFVQVVQWLVSNGVMKVV